MDQIQINGLRVMARHGYTKEETIMEQEFEMDVILYCSLDKAAQTDDVNDTIDSGALIKCLSDTLKRESYALVETATQKLVESVFDFSPMIGGVELTLKKTQSGILADFDSVGVKLIRARSEVTPKNCKK